MESRIVAQHDIIKEGETSIPDDRLRPTSLSSASSPESASSDFSFEDPYSLDINEHGSFALEHDRTNDNSKLILETPPAQVMERPADTSDYRIPSHVFASNKSSNPNPDWSTASNESLFSIHTGNMSFNRDQFNWMLKSGELGLYAPGDIPKSGELPPPSPRIVLKSGDQKPVGADTCKPGEQVISNHFKVSAAAPPVVEVKSLHEVNEAAVSPGLTATTLNSKKDDFKPEVNITKGRTSLSDEVSPSNNVSPHSDASCQSFAFPVLAEIDRDKSVNSDQSRAEQKNISSNTEQEGPKTPTSAASAAPTSSSWFSCFTRCSCC